MEITTQEFKQAELITVRGRVDSAQAAGLTKALESAGRRAKPTIVVDMSGVEYMSSAGFRALGDAQRNSQRHQRGGVVLVNVSAPIREALDLVGFTEYFRLENSVAAAMAYAENLAASDNSPAD